MAPVEMLDGILKRWNIAQSPLQVNHLSSARPLQATVLARAPVSTSPFALSPTAMSDPVRRHPPPSYDDDQEADPYVYDDGDAPDYENPDYLTEDPNPRFAQEEEEETDEFLAGTAMDPKHSDVVDVDDEVAADALEHEGDIDVPDGYNARDYDVQDDGGDGDWLEAGRDPENVRREMADREPGAQYEELDDTYNMDDDDDETA
ncbi:hypothetical protein EDD36DRAFT_191194 [Exophiala viscosa]|uniref:Uncharacterized protein n=1 Tax=Exophiala viscosa TaxID=2486360 RepID=A0AAN6E0B1_9EURO|nr:hypothetical protein EDD36DRAFT_191194 [Exophiala viscosa]